MEFKECNWSAGELDNYWRFEAKRGDRYFSIRHGASIARWFASYLDPGGSVLDFGAGIGALSTPLIDSGFRVYSVERSKEALRQIEESCSSDSLIGCSSSLDDVPVDQGFDGIALVEVIEHLRSEEATALLLRLSSFLTKGGFVFITTPNGEELSNGHICCPSCRTYFHKWQHLSSWSPTELHRVLRSAQFAPLEISEIDWDVLRLPWLPRMLRNWSDRLAPSVKLPDIKLVARKL